MLKENRIALSKHRMDKAQQCLQSAKNLLEDGDYFSSANRSYYAIFHAARAVMALDGLDFKKHSAVIAKFRELYIKTGIFDVRFSNVLGHAFELRGDCDYEDFYIVTKQEVEVQIENADDFLKTVQKYVDKMVSMQ